MLQFGQNVRRESHFRLMKFDTNRKSVKGQVMGADVKRKSRYKRRPHGK